MNTFLTRRINWISCLILLPTIISAQDVLDNQFNHGPCGRWRPGDGDLNTFDLIREFHLDQTEERYESITEVGGTNFLQRAYRLQKESNLTMRAVEAFPKGVPHQFSFECTYRVRHPPKTAWHLFHLSNYYEESQMTVTMNPRRETLELVLPDITGRMQTASFRHSSLFDKAWHKVTLGVTNDHARLWVDCHPVQGLDGGYTAALQPRGQFDTTDGYVSVAKMASTPVAVSSSPLIDLQWMVLSCDPTKPERDSCDELPKYAVAPLEPDLEFATGPQPVCDVPCPRGPPGYNGTDGRPGQPGRAGLIGEPGIPGLRGRTGVQGVPGRPGLPGTGSESGGVKGEKGDQGEFGLAGLPGAVGIGIEGPVGPPGLKGDRGEPGLPGEYYGAGTLGAGQPGSPGFPGFNGTKGDTGNKGDRGERGFTGIQGLPGAPGTQGPPGEVRYREFSTGEGESIVGPVGLTGAPGQEGSPGRPGTPGRDGTPGHPGKNGQDGIGHLGAPGQPGLEGPPGHPGPPGQSGQPGIPGLSGNGGGDQYSESYIRDMCASVLRDQLEELTANLIGPPGPPGPASRPGKMGLPGPAGIPGDQGSQGQMGTRGFPGPEGHKGHTGPPGERGERGDKGDKGEQGVGREGPAGPRGEQGVAGPESPGIPGRQGDRGESGRAGSPGPRGAPGSAGECPVDCFYAAAANTYQVQQQQKGPQNFKG